MFFHSTVIQFNITDTGSSFEHLTNAVWILNKKCLWLPILYRILVVEIANTSLHYQCGLYLSIHVAAISWMAVSTRSFKTVIMCHAIKGQCLFSALCAGVWLLSNATQLVPFTYSCFVCDQRYLCLYSSNVACSLSRMSRVANHSPSLAMPSGLVSKLMSYFIRGFLPREELAVFLLLLMKGWAGGGLGWTILASGCECVRRVMVNVIVMSVRCVTRVEDLDIVWL